MKKFRVEVKLHGDNSMFTEVKAESLAAVRNGINSNFTQTKMVSVGSLVIPMPNVLGIEITELVEENISENGAKEFFEKLQEDNPR